MFDFMQSCTILYRGKNFFYYAYFVLVEDTIGNGKKMEYEESPDSFDDNTNDSFEEGQRQIFPSQDNANSPKEAVLPYADDEKLVGPVGANGLHSDFDIFYFYICLISYRHIMTLFYKKFCRFSKQ